MDIDKETLESIAKEKFNIQYYNVEGLDNKVVVEIMAVLTQLFKKYAKIKGKVFSLAVREHEHEDESDMIMSVSQLFDKEKNKLYAINIYYERLNKIKNAPYEAKCTICHEFAHIIDDLLKISDKSKFKNLVKRYNLPDFLTEIQNNYTELYAEIFLGYYMGFKDNSLYELSCEVLNITDNEYQKKFKY